MGVNHLPWGRNSQNPANLTMLSSALPRSVTTSCRRFIPHPSLSTEGFLAAGTSPRQMNSSRNLGRSPLTGKHFELGLRLGSSPWVRGWGISDSNFISDLRIDHRLLIDEPNFQRWLYFCFKC